jgi:anti-sigma factor RsiW
MNCIELVAHVSEFLDGEMDHEIRRAFQAHLKECPRCEELLISLKKTLELAKRAPKESLPPHIKRSIHDAVRKCMRDR